MIYYVCKYAPVEIFLGFDEDIVRADMEKSSFTGAESAMHANMCSVVKGLYEYLSQVPSGGILLTSCCDGMRRLYDALKKARPDLFIFLIDVPAKTSSVAFYEYQIDRLIRSYEAYSGKTFDEKKFLKGIKEVPEEKTDGIPVALMGAHAGESVRSAIRRNGGRIQYDFTCDRARRPVCYTDRKTYARSLLEQFPCMRMVDNGRREAFYKEKLPRVQGIIYHTVQFCDMYSFEYMALRRDTRPVLHLDTDLTGKSMGQICTRIEAFMESLGGRRKKTKGQLALGIDSGSTSTNAVVMDKNRNILSKVVIRTGPKAGESAEKAYQEAISLAGVRKEDIDVVVATGYGRDNIAFADRAVTEISCHALGAHYFCPEARTILDIGGQDSKAIRVGEKGEVLDFVMNDKCAAGTGRFLEAIARTLEISTAELSRYALEARHDVEITSMCTVFAESEVISLIAKDVDPCDIAKGVSSSIAGKAVSLMKRVKMTPPFMMTGGVAKNAGVVRALEEMTGEKFTVGDNPEIAGACGAALYGLGFDV